MFERHRMRFGVTQRLGGVIEEQYWIYNIGVNIETALAGSDIFVANHMMRPVPG
jgi:hypothetical protein